MQKCQCGFCDRESSTTFLRGHDQTLRMDLERRVGGLLNLKSLVHAAESYMNGDIAEVVFSQSVRKIFSSAGSDAARGQMELPLKTRQRPLMPDNDTAGAKTGRSTNRKKEDGSYLLF